MLGENGDDEWAFVIVDGFILYWDEDVMRELDARMFVRGSYEVLKKRREERQGYITLEGMYLFFFFFLLHHLFHGNCLNIL